MSESTTETVTQHGIRRPNGEISWETPATPKFANIVISYAVNDDRVLVGGHYENGREALRSQLRKVAEEVGIDPKAFVDGHSYVSRQILTIIMEPVTGDSIARITHDLPF